MFGILMVNNFSKTFSVTEEFKKMSIQMHANNCRFFLLSFLTRHGSDLKMQSRTCGGVDASK